jgi:hypothetical protein
MPTEAPSTTPRPQPPPSPSVTPPTSPIHEWPVSVGDYWVYSSKVYGPASDKAFNTEIITATFMVTDTVQRIWLEGRFFIAEFQREVRFIGGNDQVDFVDVIYPGTRWYAIDDTSVYMQQQMPANNQNEATMWLEYKFPFSENQCWFPNPDNRRNFSPELCNRQVTGPMSLDVPTGKFNDCYEILTIYLSGGTLSWFCSNVGPVKAVWDHNGTPFGFEEVLIRYQVK